MKRSAVIREEWTNCPLCGADARQSAPRYSLPDRFFPAEGTFTFVECRECQFTYLNPRPTPDTIGYYYQDYDLVDSFLARVGWMRAARRIARIRHHYPLGPHTQALDIGCGMGDFLSQLRRSSGCQVTGVEIRDEARTYCQDKLGIGVRLGELQDIHFPDASFDLVTMFHVFEHIHQPRELAAEIYRILRPGGYFVAEVPNYDSRLRKHFQDRWIWLHPPNHLSQFTRPTARDLLQRSGFASIEIDDFPYAVGEFVASQWGQHTVAGGVSQVESTSRPITRVQFAAAIGVILLELPLLIALSRTGQGGHMTIYARKDE